MKTVGLLFNFLAAFEANQGVTLRPGSISVFSMEQLLITYNRSHFAWQSGIFSISIGY